MRWTWSRALWTGLAVTLALATFGLSGIKTVTIMVGAFLFGLLMSLYLHGRTKSRNLLKQYPMMKISPPKTGIPVLVTDVKRPRPSLKLDKRMTGASQIDEALQEVLDYTYRDYILSWYKRISEDEEFQREIRHTLQKVVIAFSERAKVVDLVPYLTTQLVDDFASHFRLYRRALDKYRENAADSTKPPPDLDNIFFDLETEMEKNLCRDMICLSEENERQYLQDLSEVLLFLLLPPEDFHNKPFRYIIREVLVNGVFLPAVNLLSDPDYINQTLQWLCQNSAFTSETFTTVVKTSDNVEELKAVKAKVDIDVTRQRSKDTGGTDDTLIKQQLGSLVYMSSVCEGRIKLLQEGKGDAIGLSDDLSSLVASGQKLYSLQMDVVMNNNVGLSSFMEYMTNIGAQGLLFLYLNIEAYKVSAEQQISAALLNESEGHKPDLDMLSEAARSIYDQYLSDKANAPVTLDEHVLQKLRDDIRNPNDTIFNTVQSKLWRILEEKYYPEFIKSQLYIKLLAELDLLRDPSKDSEDGTDKESLSSKDSETTMSSEDSVLSGDPGAVPDGMTGKPKWVSLSAEITNTGICKEHGKAYAVYMITVAKKFQDNTEEKWDVYRRYSDFHDLHMTIHERYDSLPGLVLPGKKTFNNMNKEFLEKRRIGLNAYLQYLLKPSLLSSHKGLVSLVHQFLEHIIWEKEKSQFTRKMDTLVNPLRTVGNIVRAMPDNFADGVAKVSGGIRSIPTNMLDGVGRVLHVKGTDGLDGPSREELLKSGKVSAVLDTEQDDEIIPLRIMLLLMDEVFDLKNRNQWLRRRIVTILRQIVKATLGDSINKKIVEHVEWMTSADQVAEYVKAFRDSFWPNGILAEPRPTRDHETKMRTRVVCKAKMLGSISDEVRHLIGSETTRQGVFRVFNMFQQHRLNKRLLYVCLEGLLQTLFPDNKFTEVFTKVHSRSPRVKNRQPKTDKEAPKKRKPRV